MWDETLRRAAGAGGCIFAAWIVVGNAGADPGTVSAPGSGADAPREKIMNTVKIESRAFAAMGDIPVEHTCDGKDLSPPLRWGEAPPGTRTWVLISDDPDAPVKTWVHWVLYNLPAAIRELPEGVPPAGELPDGARQGRNDFGRVGYGGPCPPHGKPHRYFFRLYALDRKLDLSSGATKDRVMKAIDGHVLGRGELIGNYARR